MVVLQATACLLDKVHSQVSADLHQEGDQAKAELTRYYPDFAPLGSGAGGTYRYTDTPGCDPETWLHANTVRTYGATVLGETLLAGRLRRWKNLTTATTLVRRAGGD